jgi:hypothetical protein
MEIKKFSDFQYINEEDIWSNIKYGLGKLGRYKANGKILGKGETDKEAAEEIGRIMGDTTNAALSAVYEIVKEKSPKWPNDKSRVAFLRGILMYGQFYDSIVAAAEKSPEEEGYLDPEVANKLIENTRKVVKKALDIDLAAVYSVMDSNNSIDLNKEELLFEEVFNLENEPINEEEEFLKKLVDLKNKAMDKMFGAKKGQDAEQKTTKGQSAKLQQTSGEKNVESERIKGLESDKLPLVLAGVGGALGAIGWIAQTQWFKDLITTTIKHPAQFGEKTFTTTVENNLKVDPKGWSYTIQNNGFMDATGKSLNFDQPASNLKDAFTFYGGGDQSKGIEAMSNFLGEGGRGASVADITSQLSDPSNKTVGDVFNKLEGTFGDKMLMSQNGGAKSFIAKQVYTETRKVLIKAGFTTTTTSAAGSYLISIAPVLTALGITLISAGIVVKLLREKGQRQSRAKTLNDLLQSLVLVKITDKNKYKGEEGSDEGTEKDEEKSNTDVPTEKSIYPLMIKNLTQLKSLIITSEGVKLEGEGGDKGIANIKIGKEYFYTNKKGEKKKVKVISLTHDTTVGKDKTWLTKDDVKKTNLAKGSVSVIFKDKKGEYSSSSPEMAVDFEKLSPIKESVTITRFDDIVLEDKKIGTQRNVEVTKGEDYLTQAVSNIRKSLKSIVDEKDKGIGITKDFIQAILDKKMDSNTKAPVKELYAEVYDYLYGKKSKTLGEFAPLYKESVEIISNKGKRQVVAEKMARFTKRSLQFEGEGFYGGMGEFGADLQDFNNSFKQIMSYFKEKGEVSESKIYKFKDM